MDWLICTPVWGERCESAFLGVTLPCLRAAIAEGVSGRVRFAIHTTSPDRLSDALSGFEVEFHPVPEHPLGSHHMAGVANRLALARARPNECVAFVNADMACSIELFKAAEARFSAGKRMIVMAASRTIGEAPDVGMKSRDLLAWTMTNAHPSIRECFWKTGRSNCPWAIYFKRGPTVTLHGFHLHPFAVVNDRDMTFGASIDKDLFECFTRDEIHIVTDADECAFAEMSPPDRVFPLLKDEKRIRVKSIVKWAKSHATPVHRWLFQHPIAIIGDGRNGGAMAVCVDILEELKKYVHPPSDRKVADSGAQATADHGRPVNDRPAER